METELSAKPGFDPIALQQLQLNDLKTLADSAKVGKVAFKEPKTETKRAPEPGGNLGEGNIYFFHPDHLGTATYLTDINGNPYQFFLNLPFGETMAEQHSFSEDYENPFKFNGKELDEETGLYYYGARYYDPRVSVWLSVDPLAEKFPNWNPYNYTMQNPINLIDPTGMEATENDGWIKNRWTGEVTYDENVTGPENTPSNSTYLCQECTLSELPLQSFGVTEYLKGDNLNQDGTRNHVIYLSEVFIGDPNSLDPSTIGKNFMGLTYPGGNNPRTYAGDYDYTHIPSDLSEFPAIGHDRRYDKLNIQGASGLFFDPRAIGADWKFVKEEINISMTAKNKKTRYRAGILGTGLGMAALPKTLIALSTQQGFIEALMWYTISNTGVNNIPNK